MGIKLFAPDRDVSSVPQELRHLGDWSQRRLAKFAIGREVAGLPLGLIIYAARNQYNHFEERLEELNEDNRAVIELLAQRDILIGHLLTIDPPKPLSYRIVEMLGWKHYTLYEQDMRDLADKMGS